MSTNAYHTDTNLSSHQGREAKSIHHWSLHFDDMFIWQHCELAWLCSRIFLTSKKWPFIAQQNAESNISLKVFQTLYISTAFFFFFFMLKRSRHSQVLLSKNICMNALPGYSTKFTSFFLYKLCAGLLYRPMCGAITRRKPRWFLSDWLQAALSRSKA